MSPMKTKILAVVRNSVDPRFTYTVEASPKSWASYKMNYRIKPNMIVSVKEVAS